MIEPPKRPLARLATPGPDFEGVPPTLTEALAVQLEMPRAAQRGLRFVDARERERFVSWQEIARRAAVAARRLEQRGVRRGDRVALVFTTGPSFFDTFFGALWIGAVPTPLYPPVRLGKMPDYDHRTAAMLSACGARIVLVEPRVERLMGGVRAAFEPELGFVAWQEMEASGSDSGSEWAAASVVDPEDLALVQFSSGTTSAPKAVALSHRALLHQAAILAGHWPDTEDVEHSGASWLPLYHDMGLVGCVFPALLRTADLWLMAPEAFIAKPALWLRLLSRSGASVSVAPDFAYALCADRIRDDQLDDVDLSRWRAALNGAETVSMETMARFTQRFAPYGFRVEAMTPVYGMSEAALAVTFASLQEPPRTTLVDHADAEEPAVPAPPRIAAVSVGRPVPGFEIEIRDREEVTALEPLEEGRVGEVWLRGPSLLRGVLRADGSIEDVLEGGWLRSGDLGFVQDGELFLTGRKKDVLVLRGRNVAPDSVEEAVSALPGVRTGCVVAVTAPRSSWLPNESSDLQGRVIRSKTTGGEELWVLAETREPKGALQDLEARCRAAVRSATGLEIGRLDLLAPGELPRTSSGKLRRGAARELATAGRLQAAGDVSLVDRLKRQSAVEAGLALLHSRRAQRLSGE